MKTRLRIPIGLPIAGVVLLVAGLLLQPVVAGLPEEVLVRNTIIAGIPFILIFVSIIIFFITAIWLLSSVLNDRVPMRVYRPIERVIIAGIVLGVIGMFQPWLHILYRLGFHLLLVSTISFIVWSHIRPAGGPTRTYLTTPADVDEMIEAR
jgi:hypothetical protein